MSGTSDEISQAISLAMSHLKGRDNALLFAIALLFKELQKTNAIDGAHYLALLDRYAGEGLDSQSPDANESLKATLQNLAGTIRAISS